MEGAVRSGTAAADVALAALRAPMSRPEPQTRRETQVVDPSGVTA
jgi:hypothetical protein